MKWLEPKNKCGGRKISGPDAPAVGVRIYLHHKDGQRVCFLLNSAFIKASRLQPGDRLAIGIDEALGVIGLKRSDRGNSISGNGWSVTREGKPTKGNHATPYVSFGCKAYPGIDKWAEVRVGKWVVMHDKQTHWESTE